jgi:hypothetical protein
MPKRENQGALAKLGIRFLRTVRRTIFRKKMRGAVDICGKRVYSICIMKTISVNSSIRFYGFFWRFTA